MASSGVESLTETERECLRLVIQGLQSKEIAIALNRPLNTVERQIKAARAKLGDVTRAQAARMLAAAEGDQSLVDQSLSVVSSLPIDERSPGQHDAMADDDEVREDRMTFELEPVQAPPKVAENVVNALNALPRLLLIAVLTVLLSAAGIVAIALTHSTEELGRFVNNHR